MATENINEYKQGYNPLGFVLLDDTDFDTNYFLFQLKKEWNIEVRDMNYSIGEQGIVNVSFWVNEMQFILTLIPCQFPDNKAVEDSKLNYLWENALDEVSRHNAILSVAIIKNYCLEQINTCIIFTKICSTLMLLKNTCAMYMSKQGLIIEPQQYRNKTNIIKAAESHGKDFLPIENWIRIGLYKDEHGYSGYTYGLKEFNKTEMEILDKEIEISEIYQLLNKVVFNVLYKDMNLQNGDVIKLDDDIEAIIKKSDGVFVEGETLKIIL